MRSASSPGVRSGERSRWHHERLIGPPESPGVTGAAHAPCPGHLIIIAFAAAGLPAADDVAGQIRTLTGTRTKLVWIRALSMPYTDGNDPLIAMYGEPGGHQLVVLDTSEGGERIFQAGPGSFANPLITRDGGRVIWSDIDKGTAWIADWNGANKRKLADGDCAFALATHWDATT